MGSFCERRRCFTANSILWLPMHVRFPIFEDTLFARSAIENRIRCEFEYNLVEINLCRIYRSNMEISLIIIIHVNCLHYYPAPDVLSFASVA